MKVLLDDVDVTAEMKRQLGSKADELSTKTPFLPSQPNKWFDLMKLVNSNATLRDKFFDSGSLHTLTIQGDDTKSFKVKMIARQTYARRNA